MPFLPVDFDPFAESGAFADGDPEATAAAAASQAMQPATQPFVDLAGNLANTLAVQPLRDAYNTTDRVLSGQGFTPEEALNTAGLAMAGSTGVGGFGAGPRIRAYHGSPHDFDAFDLSKIGTGEGAQTYGQGLYFAENPEVADTYRRGLSSGSWNVVDPSGQIIGPVGTVNTSRDLAESLIPHVEGEHYIRKSIGDVWANNPDNPINQQAVYRNAFGSMYLGDKEPEARSLIDGMIAQAQPILDQYRVERPGHSYEVNIDADPDSFLHWDQPLANQPEPVRQAVTKALAPSPDALDYWRGRLQDDFDQNGPGGYSQSRFDRAINEAIQNGGYGDEFGNRVWGEIHEAAPEVGPEFTDFMQRHGVGIDPSDTGRQAYALLADKHSNEAAASQALLENGIPGIKYPDQGSRAEAFDIYPSDSGGWKVYDKRTTQLTEFPTQEEANQYADSLKTHNYVMFDPKMVEIIRKYGLAPLVAGGAMTLGGSAQAATHALPVENDPFADPAPGSTGDPEAAGAAAASQAMQPATQPFVDLAGNLANTLAVQPIRGAYNTMDNVLAGRGFTTEDALNAAGLAMAGSSGVGGLGAGPRIRAYHGSPHDFTAFDMNRIGTGEGAQAYGHGLYFAENPGVAASYQDRLSHPARVQIDQTPLPYIDGKLFEPQNHSIMQVAQSSRDPQVVRANLEKYITDNGHDNPYAHADDAQQIIDAIDAGTYHNGLPGRMYEVGIDADPESFLHWDKPLSEQSPQVQNALSDVAERVAQNRAKYSLENTAEPTGAAVYESSMLVPGEYRDPAQASQELLRRGISGIKYADQGSRGAYTVIPKNGEWGVLKPDGNEWLHSFPTQDEAAAKAASLNDFNRTSNYVMFDPKMVEIIRKYGLAPLVAGGALTLGGNAQAATHAVPVQHDPFADLPAGSTGDPEAAGAVAASQAFQPALAGHLSGVGSDLTDWATRQAAMNSRLSGQPLAAQALDPEAIDSAQAIGLGTGPGAIRAYHGSPHDFNFFDSNRIGTGEGAQVYGHGLYFADKEGVAKSYRDRLGSQGTPLGIIWRDWAGAQPYDVLDSRISRDLIPDDVRRGASELHARFSPYGSNLTPDIVNETRERLGNTIANYQNAHAEGRPLMSPTAGFSPDEALSLEKWQLENVQAAKNLLDDPLTSVRYPKPNSGKMYEVGIDADPESLLSWDKPLYQQPPEIQSRVQQIATKYPDGAPTPPGMDWGAFAADYRNPLAELLEGTPLSAGAKAMAEDALTKGNWDIPAYLAEYAPERVPAANALLDQYRATLAPTGASGGDWYEALDQAIIDHNRDLSDARTGQLPEHRNAADALLGQNIPGIKYLDQQSRNAAGWHIIPSHNSVSGKWIVKSSDYNSKGLQFDTEAEAQQALQDKIGSQTHNYVMFDDKMIDILRKYGLAGLVAGGAMTLGGNSQAATHALPVDSDPFGTGAASPF